MAIRTPARTQGTLDRRAKESYVTRRVFLPAQDFIHRAGVSGMGLLLASVVALLWANLSWNSYHHFWETPVSITVGSWQLNKTLHHIVNDGLMAVFFFVIGLEIKRELMRGDLSSPRRAMMPVAAALGGMIGPALIYAAFNWGTPEITGWGVPMATDIAFALGVLALLGNRVPSELRILLLGLAIVDDIGSILVIAVFYTEKIHFTALTVSAALAILILLMRRLGFSTVAAYVLMGMLFWLAVWESGVHATLAGVVLGAMTRLRPTYPQAEYDSPRTRCTRVITTQSSTATPSAPTPFSEAWRSWCAAPSLPWSARNGWCTPGSPHWCCRCLRWPMPAFPFPRS
jgi:Na+:H+ antiporter, NhaA family